jgi:predicted nucleic acid-binding protein
MAAFVLDSSVALAWFMPGEQTPGTETLLDRATEEGAVTSGLWPLEVANIVLIAERKRRITQAQRVRALTALAKLPIEIDTDTAGRAWNSTFDLALAHGLTLYDAGYLDLSLRSGLPLATLDQALGRAACACGVPILGMREREAH